MTDLQWSPAEIAAAQASAPYEIRTILPSPEPYAKQRLVMCYVCHGWLMKGTLGPKGCPHCGGAL